MRIRAIGDTVISHRLFSDDAVKLVAGESGSFDVSIGNLETPLTDQGWPADKYRVIRSSPESVHQYERLGIDVWSLATNHAVDFGVPGLLQTMKLLSDTGLSYVGAGNNIAEAIAPLHFETDNGEKVAFLNFCSTLTSGSVATPHRPGVAPIRIGQSFEFDGSLMDEQPGTPPRMNTWVQEVDAVRAEQAVSSASQDADHVVVAMHWGVSWPYLPLNQGPLADYQRPLAHRLIDAGAKVIIGTHSHTLHPIEFYGRGVILYSLGNFLFHPGNALSDEEERLVPAVQQILRGGPWNESAVFDIDLNDTDVSIRVFPISLDEAGEPHEASIEQRAAALDRLHEMSKHIDPAIQNEDGIFTVPKRSLSQ